MRVAILAEDGVTVDDVLEVERIEDRPGAVACPDHNPGDVYTPGVGFSTRVKTPDEIDRAARDKLSAIDMASIRAMREYIAARADAPAILKTRDAEAAIERGKLRP